MTALPLTGQHHTAGQRTTNSQRSTGASSLCRQRWMYATSASQKQPTIMSRSCQASTFNCYATRSACRTCSTNSASCQAVDRAINSMAPVRCTARRQRPVVRYRSTCKREDTTATSATAMATNLNYGPPSASSASTMPPSTSAAHSAETSPGSRNGNHHQQEQKRRGTGTSSECVHNNTMSLST